MAHCVNSSVLDSDDMVMKPGCVVHIHWAPCPLNGEPACTTPLHTDTRPGRDAAVRFWRLRTHGQRPLVLHHGSFGDDREHNIETDVPDCWCDPEYLLGGEA